MVGDDEIVLGYFRSTFSEVYYGIEWICDSAYSEMRDYVVVIAGGIVWVFCSLEHVPVSIEYAFSAIM
jgi:hypothetical protein